jgi:hypothetical protein
MATDSPNSPKNKLRSNSGLMRYASMGTQILVTIGLFVFAGVKLDQWLKLKFPAFTLALSLLGVVVGIYFAIKDLLKK